MSTAYFKLRANVELEGDTIIAQREIKALCSKFSLVKRNELIKSRQQLKLAEEHFLSNAREGDVIGFIGEITEGNLNTLITKSSFVQEIWLLDLPTKLKRNHSKDYIQQAPDSAFCIVPLFAMAELLTYCKTSEINLSHLRTFTQHLANNTPDGELEKIVRKSTTSTPHVHGLHKYKAKFFPRLVRTLLLGESRDKSDIKILDPFVGSGTALIEASFMGYKSVGVDIDKLSCLISESKIKLLSLPVDKIQKEVAEYYTGRSSSKSEYKFPSWISKKFDRWGNVDEREVYEKEISNLTKRLPNLNGSKKLFETAISDAVSRKFNIRMMGTGVGRFALEIQKLPLNRTFDNNIKFLAKASSVVNALRAAYEIELKTPEIINGTATELPIKDSSIDLILTSPPYLPASSGREDYLIGKSISITALNLMSERDIELAEERSVGSMKSLSTNDAQQLPKSVYELYDFLKNDELRKIKANPTIAYYNDIRRALDESFRVLVPGGKAIYIIGKESVFYTFKSREVLFKVECDKIFEEMAKKAGFIVREVVDIELNKKNKNARPRSLDKYFESALILEKPKVPAKRRSTKKSTRVILTK
ncbi:MAG: hypothetical protein BGO54_13335 [Sphingobacteriales bacterium 46-32]|nr:MAG: hypothetical protein BGO54_13335 [Sphingobacteriales bacterium 46-32]